MAGGVEERMRVALRLAYDYILETKEEDDGLPSERRPTLSAIADALDDFYPDETDG